MLYEVITMSGPNPTISLFSFTNSMGGQVASAAITSLVFWAGAAASFFEQPARAAAATATADTAATAARVRNNFV